MLTLIGCAIVAASLGHLQVSNPFGTHFAVVRFTIAIPTVATAVALGALDDRLHPSLVLPGRSLASCRALWLALVTAAVALSLAPMAHLVGGRQVLIDAAALCGSGTLIVVWAGSAAAMAWPLLVLLPYLLETEINGPPRWAMLEPHATPHASVIATVIFVLAGITYAARGPRPSRDVAGDHLD